MRIVKHLSAALPLHAQMVTERLYLYMYFLKKIDINYFTWATINISLTRVIIEMATLSLPNNKRKSV